MSDTLGINLSQKHQQTMDSMNDRNSLIYTTVLIFNMGLISSLIKVFQPSATIQNIKIHNKSKFILVMAMVKLEMI